MRIPNASPLNKGLSVLSEFGFPIYTFQNGALVAPWVAPEGQMPQVRMVIVYQDEATRDWAKQKMAGVVRFMGKHSVQSTWWSTDHLKEPLLLLRAAQATSHADIVLVSLRCDGPFPAAFFHWLISGFARRTEHLGSLMALLLTEEKNSPSVLFAQFFLATLARDHGMDFLASQQMLPKSLHGVHGERMSFAA
jgi:hypothetical protein